MSVFFNGQRSSTVLPRQPFVASDELAMAEPQPNVLNFASSMMPSKDYLHLQLHDVAAFRRAHHTGAHVGMDCPWNPRSGDLRSDRYFF